MSLVATTITITDNAIPTGVALAGIVVRVYNADGTVFITEGDTDENGVLIMELEDGFVYWVRFYGSGYRFNPRLTISVDSGESSNAFAVEGIDLTVRPPATDPNLCRVSGMVLNAAGCAAPGVTFEFVMTGKPRVVGGRVMVSRKVIVRSDADGDVDVDLVRNGIYDVMVEGHDDEVFRIKVPDYAYVDITDLIWPYVASVSFSENTVTLAAGATTTVDVTLMLSSRTTVPYDLDNGDVAAIGMFATITSSDEGVATISFDEDGVMTISAVASGTATISVELIDGVTSEREPTPTTTLETVVVTVT